MTQPTAAPSGGGNGPQEADRLREMLRNRAYLRGLAFSALIGIPVSLIAFWFLVLLQELEKGVWQGLPQELGLSSPPWWWSLPAALLSGVIVGAVVSRLPGKGGHVPAGGLHAGGASAAALPGVVLAALGSLPLGAVLGPEAPLIALGGGLAVLLAMLVRVRVTEQSSALLGAAGSAAAISALFGNPVIGAILLIEVAGVGGPQLFAVLLPALLSSGIGALVFTGFGRWTGLKAGSLSLDLPHTPPLEAGDVLWSVLMAAAIGAVLHWAPVVGRRTAAFVAGRPFSRTVLCAVTAGCFPALYALSTGRSPAEAALSGQGALTELAGNPQAWSAGALVAVLAFKTAGYAVCLGALRGGPVFPSLFLGAAAGVLCAPLPGLGTVTGMAVGMAAASATMLKLPLSSVVLVTLIVEDREALPVIVLAVVVAFVTTELMPRTLRGTRGAGGTRFTRAG
ncbi:chloride channel protein [Streptomyces meridianus]|uniref:Chloride channel protein n=1 Tax=Streptomyces meridianus TaxID=2938945 RepID=A0ABT0XDF2_9ACTN|nr:chloride channel protein [Streptomyces meridianus]MCM2579799.1 chloride channel protein [Streptomyces meridianus]